MTKLPGLGNSVTECAEGNAMKRMLVIVLSVALGLAGCARESDKPAVQVGASDGAQGEAIPPEADGGPDGGTDGTAPTSTTVTTGQPAGSAPSTTRPKATATTRPAGVTTTTQAPGATTTSTQPGTTATTASPAPRVVDGAMRPDGKGGWLVRSDGSVITAGNAPNLGSALGRVGTATDIIASPSGNGYWITGQAGEVVTFGDAWYSGDMADRALNRPVAGLVPDSDDNGYWLMADDGGVFAFVAPFLGSAGGIPHGKPMISFQATPTRKGYWMATADGVVHPFGDAAHYGDFRNSRLLGDVLHMAPLPNGRGYYMLGQDGGLFSFAEARFHGSMAGIAIPAPIVTMEPTPTGLGYWLIGGDGTLYPFGDASTFIPRS